KLLKDDPADGTFVLTPKKHRHLLKETGSPLKQTVKKVTRAVRYEGQEMDEDEVEDDDEEDEEGEVDEDEDEDNDENENDGNSRLRRKPRSKANAMLLSHLRQNLVMAAELMS
ncbi:hypothetical protein BGX26_002496, partial [Mortierella sp. AD094]